MSPEKPNAGKPVQLSEGFIIMQFLNTIWVPKPAHPTENNLGSSTSPLETDALAETLDKHSDSSSAPICPKKPNVSLSGLRQPLCAQRWPCITLNWPAPTLGGPASAFWPSASVMLASMKHCVAPGCLFVALREPWLLLHHSLWLLR